MAEPEQDFSNRQLNQAQQQAVYEDEIDLRELFMVLWRGKWVIVVITFMAAVTSVFVALSLPNVYRAEALLAPANTEDSGGLAGLASQYGGLASLAGINLSGSGADKTALGIEVLQSRKFIGDFVARRDILVPLMAVKGWELKNNQLLYDNDLYDSNAKKWVRDVEPPRLVQPSALEAYEAFREVLDVSQSSETGFIKVSVEHYSPYIAKQWVDWLIEDINFEIKQQDVIEAESSIGYIQEQLQSTSLTELQAVFYQLIEEQTKTVMIAKSRPEYLFRSLDPAVVAEKKEKPRRALICILGVFFGFCLGFFFVIGRHVYVQFIKG